MEKGKQADNPQGPLPLRTYLPEHFADDFAEEIQCLYRASKDYCQEYGLPLLQKLSLDDFFDVCTTHSVIAPPKN